MVSRAGSTARIDHSPAKKTPFAMTTPKVPHDAARQLPVDGEVFLDHVGHFVADADAAAAALAKAGFFAAPRSVQVVPDGHGGTTPTGTGNVTAMFARGYVEVLFKTADTPLGREFESALSRHAGVHLAAFAVHEAGTAHARLEKDGFRVRPLVHMQRPVDTETGPGIAAFTVARVEAGEMAEGRMQFVTHHTEATVFQPRWLAHENGATGLADMVVAVADRHEAAARFSRFLDRPGASHRLGEFLRLDRGGLLLTEPAVLSHLVPGLAIPSLPFIGVYAVTVRSLAVLERVLESNGLAFRREGNIVTARFPEPLGIGAWLFAESPEHLPWRRAG
jgi:hypothetical protein